MQQQPNFLNAANLNDSAPPPFLQMNWSHAQEANQEVDVYPKQENNEMLGSNNSDRRTPYSATDGQNGYAYNSYFDRKTPVENGNNNNPFPPSNVNESPQVSNGTSNAQFNQTSAYSSNNQSQSFALNAEYSARESNASSPANHIRSQESNSFRATSASPGRSTGNGIVTPVPNSDSGIVNHNPNSQNDEANEAHFLANTTTSMLLSDLTTSMNTSTGRNH